MRARTPGSDAANGRPFSIAAHTSYTSCHAPQSLRSPRSDRRHRSRRSPDHVHTRRSICAGAHQLAHARRQLRRGEFPFPLRRDAAQTASSLPHARLSPSRPSRARGQRHSPAARHGRRRPYAAQPGVLKRSLRPWSALRYQPLLPDPAGRHRPWSIVEAFGRPAHELSSLHLRRHGRLAAPDAA